MYTQEGGGGGVVCIVRWLLQGSGKVNRAATDRSDMTAGSSEVYKKKILINLNIAATLTFLNLSNMTC